jgi:hypothetical protein
LVPVLEPKLKPDSIGSFIGMNLMESARPILDVHRLTYGFLNISGSDYAAITALNHNIVRDVREAWWHGPDDGVFMGVGFRLRPEISMSNSVGYISVGHEHRGLPKKVIHKTIHHLR